MQTIVFSNQDLILLIILALWSLPWKGVALYKAAQNKSPWWFVILLIVNTVGILEILYIFIFAKKKSAEKSDTKKKQKMLAEMLLDEKIAEVRARAELRTKK